ncbi:MAG: ABC transporter ATP-binding protein [Deltaproteobacteria bacterium]|nr:ABC transporter ATP-binding protein [Deltaproteobacteria bacterium]
MMETVLEAVDLNTYYGRSHILFDVGLDVAHGETVCLMGRNGVGKTTTFRSIMGLNPPRKGKIVFKGRLCTGFAPFRMARLGVGFVPEDRRILGPFTVRENLELGRIPCRKGPWEMDRVLEHFPILSKLLNRMGGSLSGGEQQMLTIARALMGNPDVLLLDEPTEGLSPVIVGELKNLVLGLKDAATTILLSEQNIRFAMRVSDRVVIIDKGHMAYKGTIEEFKREESVQKRYLAV